MKQAKTLIELIHACNPQNFLKVALKRENKKYRILKIHYFWWYWGLNSVLCVY
jgi:hypothetical protein